MRRRTRIAGSFPISNAWATCRSAIRRPTAIPRSASHWLATLLWRWKFALALANNRIEGTRIDRKTLEKQIGGDAALMATLLNRQPVADESDAFLKSGDGLALMLASPAFQRC